MFVNVKGAAVPAFEQICRLYLKLLQSNVRHFLLLVCISVFHLLNQRYMQNPLTSEINGFLLDVMTKSMTLTLHETGELYDEATRRNRFSQDFIRNLYKLVRTIYDLDLI